MIVHPYVHRLARALHRRIIKTPDNAGIVGDALEEVLRAQGHVTLVQVGAHEGKTSNDPVVNFIQRHAREEFHGQGLRCTALLVEPVRSIYEKLKETYSGCQGVLFENSAIADQSGEREFYYLKPGARDSSSNMPEWIDQLGSLLPERMGALWDAYERDPVIKNFVSRNMIVGRVPCLTLQDLIKKHRLHSMDLLQIDTEGYDGIILKSINFEKVKPRFINYERVLLFEQEPGCRDILTRQGYALSDHGQDTLASLQTRLGWFRRIRQLAFSRWLKLVNQREPSKTASTR